MNVRTPSSPSVSWQQLFAKRSGLSGQAPGLWFEQSLNNYINGFIDQQDALAPKSPDVVVNDMTAIWQEQGWLPVDELTLTLLRRYRPTAAPAAMAVLQAQMQARYNEPEPHTGFKQKPYAPLGAALAHLFGIVTNTPVTAVLCDLSNVGKTNEHFRYLLAARQNCAPAQVPEEQARDLTDRAIRVVTGIGFEELKQAAGPRARVDAYRFGGDEFLYIGINMTLTQARQAIRKAEDQIEQFTALGGIMDHEYGKELNRHRAGFGGAFGAFTLDASTRPALDPQQTEKDIDRRKQAIGNNRRGRLARQVLPMHETAQREQPGTLSAAELLQMAYETGYLPHSHRQLNAQAKRDIRRALVKRQVVMPEQAPLTNTDCLNLLQQDLASHMATQAQEQHERFSRLKTYAHSAYPAQHTPLDDIGDKNPYQLTSEQAGHLLGVYERVLHSPDYIPYLAAIASTPTPAPQNPDLLFKTPYTREVAMLRHTLDDRQIRISAATQRAFEKALSIFSPVDFATDTLSGDVMPEVFGCFIAGAAQSGQQPAYGLAAYMHNLAGANKLLGSAGSNMILRHFAHEVVLGSFATHGFAPEDVIAGHRGSGKIVTAIKPSTDDTDMPARLEKVQETIRERMAEFQQLSVADFISAHGGIVPADLSRDLKFGQIPDRRRSEYPGLDVTTHAQPLCEWDENSMPLTGGRNLYRLDLATETIIAAKRTQRAAEYANRLTPG